MNLVAFVGTDKENLGQISALINRIDSDTIIIVKDKQAPNIAANDKCKTIQVDSSKSLFDLKTEMQEKLKPLLSKEFEVALSLASGTGKEHMALLSALLSIPVGIKLVAYTKEGIKFLT